MPVFMQSAARSGKKLSWMLKENTRGTLVKLVWNHRYQEFASPEMVCINKYSALSKKRKNCSSLRQKRSHECLLKFISRKQEGRQYYLTHNNSLLYFTYFKIVPPVGMFQIYRYNNNNNGPI